MGGNRLETLSWCGKKIYTSFVSFLFSIDCCCCPISCSLARTQHEKIPGKKLRNHKKGLVASSNSFSIWINFSLLNHPNGESFPPFCAKQSPSHTRPFALCPGVVCVYWKRGPSSNVSVHTDTYVMTYFPRKNKKKGSFFFFFSFFAACTHVCSFLSGSN
jgi:hypothetical protein